MAPSALYRYYDGRDALLSALILAAYESLAACAEEAAEQAAGRGGSDAERFAVVPRAVRTWALGHPHEWGLVFGTPVPGYEAPQRRSSPTPVRRPPWCARSSRPRRRGASAGLITGRP